MTEKMTIREGFEKASAEFAEMGDTAMVEFFEKRIALTEKKNSAERKPTPKQIENEGFKADILAWMESEKDYSVAEIAKGVPSFDAAGVKPQRVTALLTQLKDAGKVVRTEIKGKAFYRLA